jgi:hypothetical protein
MPKASRHQLLKSGVSAVTSATTEVVVPPFRSICRNAASSVREGHAAARIHWHMNLIACRDRVTSSMQHEHLGREPADDQVLPTGFSDGCARGLVQKGAR